MIRIDACLGARAEEIFCDLVGGQPWSKLKRRTPRFMRIIAGRARGRRAAPTPAQRSLSRAARSGVLIGKSGMSSRKPTKYVFVTGGVVSSIGKGLASASIGALLEARGLRVTHVKLDPYINVDPGTMSPYQHGEVFVTDDGAETDLDLGHYERFTTARMTRQQQLHDRPHLREPSSRRSGAASTSARRCRSSRTSPTRSRRASATRPTASTSRSSRSAARSATSSRSPSSRPFAS